MYVYDLSSWCWKKLWASLKFIFAHFPTKFCDVCVPGQRRHFGHFSIQKVVISGFLAYFELSNHCWSPGILTKLFSGPKFEICSASTELWFGNVFPDCLNLGWIFFWKLILRSYFGPIDIQIAFFSFNSTYR